jgi:hypothetical protein
MSGNESWQLESFVDALVVELDKTRETLGVKAINQPLSYTVKDMSMDLQIFPTFSDDVVSFTTAQPGETGASTLNLQLTAITDRQVRESTKRPPTSGDIGLDDVDIEPAVKKELRKVGVRSVADLQRMEERDVKLDTVTDKKIDYAELAESIRSARRSTRPPKVRSAELSRGATRTEHEPDDYVVLTMRGEDLALEPTFRPVATVNGEPVDLVSFGSNEVCVSLSRSLLSGPQNEVVMVLDPYAVVRLNVQSSIPVGH